MLSDSPFYQLLDDLDRVREDRARREYALQKSEQVARLERQDQSIQRQRRQIAAEQWRRQEAARRRRRQARDRMMEKSLRQALRTTSRLEAEAVAAMTALNTQHKVRVMLAELDADARAGKLDAVQCGMLTHFKNRAQVMGL